MEELKKCPFCGGEAMLKIHYGFDEKVISAFVYCEECGVATRRCALETTAIGKWNRRVENIDYIGKRAKLITLLPGEVKLSTDVLEWNGELLHGKGKQISFWKLDDEEVTIIPNKNTMVTIYDNSTVTEETEFEE